MTSTLARRKRPNKLLEQTYIATAAALGWSPDELSPRFDIDAFVAASYRQPTAAGVLQR